MRRQARVPAFAKINLTLEVLWKRDTGYHDIATVFQTIDLCDWLDITVEDGQGITVTSNIAIPGKNIAETAAERVLAALNREAKVTIHIDKRIPLGGGLGGSSTDGSAVLLALPKLLGEPIAVEVLERIAATLGSDVNFLMRGGTAAAFGRGDQTRDLKPLPNLVGKLHAPGFPVTAGEAYAALARPSIAAIPETIQSQAKQNFEALVERMQTQPIHQWAQECKNDFETVVFSKYPALATQRDEMAKAAALARMSGSGSSIFALHTEETDNPTFRTLSREQFELHWRQAIS